MTLTGLITTTTVTNLPSGFAQPGTYMLHRTTTGTTLTGNATCILTDNARRTWIGTTTTMDSATPTWTWREVGVAESFTSVSVGGTALTGDGTSGNTLRAVFPTTANTLLTAPSNANNSPGTKALSDFTAQFAVNASAAAFGTTLRAALAANTAVRNMAGAIIAATAASLPSGFTQPGFYIFHHTTTGTTMTNGQCLIMDNSRRVWLGTTTTLANTTPTFTWSELVQTSIVDAATYAEYTDAVKNNGTVYFVEDPFPYTDIVNVGLGSDRILASNVYGLRLRGDTRNTHRVYAGGHNNCQTLYSGTAVTESGLTTTYYNCGTTQTAVRYIYITTPAQGTGAPNAANLIKTIRVQ